MSEKSQRLLFAERQAELIIAALEEASPGTFLLLRQDAIRALSYWDSIQIVEVDFGSGGNDCSVAGTYTHSTSPPTISVLGTDSYRRRQFTVLHELAHHFQKQNAGLAASVRQQGANHGQFEESACDSFAAKVLIDEKYAHSWGTRSPTANDVVELFENTNASRAACSVWSSVRLRTDGVVSVLDSGGVVSFAASSGNVFPPARWSDQSETPLVARALERGGSASSNDTYIQYRNGSRSAPLYGDAAWAAGYLITVAVVDTAGWLAFSPPRLQTGRGHRTPSLCSACGVEMSWGTQCDYCGKLKCDDGHCECPQAAERICEKCFMSLHPNLFNTKVTTICINCS